MSALAITCSACQRVHALRPGQSLICPCGRRIADISLPLPSALRKRRSR